MKNANNYSEFDEQTEMQHELKDKLGDLPDSAIESSGQDMRVLGSEAYGSEQTDLMIMKSSNMSEKRRRLQKNKIQDDRDVQSACCGKKGCLIF